MEAAESRKLFRRPAHSHDYGNVSVVARVQRKQHLASRVHLFRFHSYTSAVAVIGFATPTGVLFQLFKRQQLIAELLAPYPGSAELGQDAIAVFSYCSKTSEARTITADGPTALLHCQFGWVHAAELVLEDVSDSHKEIIEQRFLLSYERLLSSRDVRELLDLPPNGYGLWKHADELQAQGVFPE